MAGFSNLFGGLSEAQLILLFAFWRYAKQGQPTR